MDFGDFQKFSMFRKAFGKDYFLMVLVTMRLTVLAVNSRLMGFGETVFH
jgi:hypothetical protein